MRTGSLSIGSENKEQSPQAVGRNFIGDKDTLQGLSYYGPDSPPTSVLPAYCLLPLPTFPILPLSLFLILLTLISSCTHSPKQAQYLVQGERLYEANCANCHQADGTGLGRLYPPLAGSDYLRDSTDAVICLIKNGISGPLTVNGIIYDQPMPGNQALTDLEIAELVTYLQVKWAGSKGLTETAVVRKTLDNCLPVD